jgi:hypothetical protein
VIPSSGVKSSCKILAHQLIKDQMRHLTKRMFMDIFQESAILSVTSVGIKGDALFQEG